MTKKKMKFMNKTNEKKKKCIEKQPG